jgi:hypothetical protein
MDRKQELIEAEDRSWSELHEILGRLNPAEMEIQGMSDGWSVKDLVWHLACWTAEGARQLECIRLDTYVDQSWGDTDTLNAGFLAEGRRQDLETVTAELVAARNRTLQEWDAVTEVSPDAEEWFYEAGPEHFTDHADELRAWVAEIESRRG